MSRNHCYYLLVFRKVYIAANEQRNENNRTTRPFSHASRDYSSFLDLAFFIFFMFSTSAASCASMSSAYQRLQRL